MPNYKPVFISSVRLSITEAKVWYRAERKELVRRLSAEINVAVASVLVNPERYSVRLADLRRVNLNVFPFAFYYSIDEARQRIVFTSFFHIKMNVPYSDTEGPELTIHEP